MAKYNKICQKCGKKFNGTSSTQKFCSIECATIEVKCSYCFKTFRNYPYRLKFNKTGECLSTCSRSCAAAKSLQDNPTRLNKFKKAGRNNLINYNKSEKGRLKSSEIGKKTIKIAHKYQRANNINKECEIHGLTMHLSGIGCLKCWNSSEKMKNVTRKRNLINWKDPEYRKKIASNLGSYLGDCYFQENNKCKIHTNQILTYKSECWDCFKEKFKNNDIVNEDFINYNSFWQNTYRLQRTNKTGQLAMEQELVDRGINWFVYIKFYEIENKIKPLQVCKSGSMIVNKSGSDVGFSTNINHGAARIFLNENNLRWHIEKILIFPTKTEKEAYELERLLIKRFGLFSS